MSSASSTAIDSTDSADDSDSNVVESLKECTRICSFEPLSLEALDGPFYDQLMTFLMTYFNASHVLELESVGIIKKLLVFCHSLLSPLVQNNQPIPSQTTMRDLFSLDVTPFKFIFMHGIALKEYPKNDEARMAIQAIPLVFLKHCIPPKYPTQESFLATYSMFKEQRSTSEINKLHNIANWTDLLLFTLSPKHKKTFIMTFIPRLAEGRNARYITGSGETRNTTDRVLIFRHEGKVEKVKRPPRNRGPPKELKKGKGLHKGQVTSDAEVKGSSLQAPPQHFYNSYPFAIAALPDPEMHKTGSCVTGAPMLIKKRKVEAAMEDDSLLLLGNAAKMIC